MVSRWSQTIDSAPQAPSPESAQDPVQTQNSRTSLLGRLGTVAPSVAMVLSMATLTVTTIVLIVTTVAGAIPLSEGSRWHSDAPWSRWDSSPEISIGDHRAVYLDLAPVDTPAPDRVDTTYVTAWLLEQ